MRRHPRELIQSLGLVGDRLTLNGFKAVRREGIHVALGFTATVDVELQIATLQENVIVERNSPVIDKQSTAIGATFDARQLADLPSARSMWAIQAATPAVYVARFDVSANATGPGGAFSAYGRAGFNRPMVEGISVTGINPTGFTLDYGAFEEVSVGTAAHGPEWHAPSVSMQFVSKPGTFNPMNCNDCSVHGVSVRRTGVPRRVRAQSRLE